MSVVGALNEAAQGDPDAAAWVIDLDRHYRHLDAC